MFAPEKRSDCCDYPYSQVSDDPVRVRIIHVYPIVSPGYGVIFDCHISRVDIEIDANSMRKSSGNYYPINIAADSLDQIGGYGVFGDE